MERDNDIVESDVGRKDFMFGTTGILLAAIAAIVLAIVT
jgi:hypothetical protein